MARKTRKLTAAQRLVYDGLRWLTRLGGPLLFHLRCRGRRHIPKEGGVLVCSNHQSVFDPVLVGLTCDRRLNYLARRSLFNIPGFSQLIDFLDAIPIDREGGGASGWKETLRRLKGGEMVLIFPEGTRSEDGEVAPFKPGFTLLARRGNAPLLPVAVDGAFQALPRRHWLPSFQSFWIEVGEPVTVEQAAAMSDAELVAEIERRVRQCHQAARRGRIRGG